MELGNFTLEKIDNDLEGGLDTVATKLDKNAMTLVAEPYYFVQGNHVSCSYQLIISNVNSTFSLEVFPAYSERNLKIRFINGRIALLTIELLQMM